MNRKTARRQNALALRRRQLATYKSGDTTQARDSENCIAHALMDIERLALKLGVEA